MNESEEVRVELESVLDTCLFPSDRRALPFLNARAGVWAFAREGRSFSVRRVGTAGPELCSEYLFGHTPHGVGLQSITVVRDPRRVAGWLGEVAEWCCPKIDGTVTDWPAPGVLFERGLTGTQVSVPRPVAEWEAIGGVVTDRDEVAHMLRTAPGLSWSTTQDVLYRMGPPAVRFDVLSCHTWMADALRMSWADLGALGRDMTRKVWRSVGVSDWMARYLDAIEPVVVAYGGVRQANFVRKLRRQQAELSE